MKEGHVLTQGVDPYQCFGFGVSGPVRGRRQEQLHLSGGLPLVRLRYVFVVLTSPPSRLHLTSGSPNRKASFTQKLYVQSVDTSTTQPKAGPTCGAHANVWPPDSLSSPVRAVGTQGSMSALSGSSHRRTSNGSEVRQSSSAFHGRFCPQLQLKLKLQHPFQD